MTWTVDDKPIEVRPRRAIYVFRAGAITGFDNPWNPGSQGAGATTITPAAIDPQFFRGGRPGDQRWSRWSARPGKDGGNHAPPWPHAGSAAASGVALRRVRADSSRCAAVYPMSHWVKSARLECASAVSAIAPIATESLHCGSTGETGEVEELDEKRRIGRRHGKSSHRSSVITQQ